MIIKNQRDLYNKLDNWPFNWQSAWCARKRTCASTHLKLPRVPYSRADSKWNLSVQVWFSCVRISKQKAHVPSCTIVDSTCVWALSNNEILDAHCTDLVGLVAWAQWAHRTLQYFLQRFIGECSQSSQFDSMKNLIELSILSVNYKLFSKITNDFCEANFPPSLHWNSRKSTSIQNYHFKSGFVSPVSGLAIGYFTSFWYCEHFQWPPIGNYWQQVMLFEYLLWLMICVCHWVKC